MLQAVCAIGSLRHTDAAVELLVSKSLLNVTYTTVESSENYEWPDLTSLLHSSRSRGALLVSLLFEAHQQLELYCTVLVQ